MARSLYRLAPVLFVVKRIGSPKKDVSIFIHNVSCRFGGVQEAVTVKQWPLLQEYQYRIGSRIEESVSKLNDHLSAYMEKKEAEAQAVYPHYFEKHPSDGLDYLIYVGASLHKDGVLDRFHVKNLRLWQFMMACGLAREAEKVKTELAVPLDTCNLILVNQVPIAIRFRYDEKRFDVDGAYDIRHEIVKSRIDKAAVQGTRERLTQPGQLAIVYSHQNEADVCFKKRDTASGFKI